ncbi:MAG: cadherin repeat domain-containing protein [Synechococcus sp.]
MKPIQVGLYDSETNELVTLLNDGQTIPARLVRGRKLAIAAYIPANSPMSGNVGSMVLNLNDGQVRRTESVAPYSLFGDNGGDFFSGRGIPAGKHKVEFSLFSQRKGTGKQLGIHTFKFEIADDSTNAAPEITSKKSVRIAENNAFVLNVNASDDRDSETQALSYELTGGADLNLFSLDTKTGRLAFKSRPDYENPLDVGADNTYNVEVTASDSQGLTDVQAIAISVSDRQENPVLRQSVQVGLYDAQTDTLITLLKDGDKIPERLVKGRTFTIVASVPFNSPLSGKVGSIHLDYNNGKYRKTENSPPYALFGDAGKNNLFSRRTIAKGKHSIALSMYSKRERGGTILDKLELNFDIVEGTNSGGSTSSSVNEAPEIISRSALSVVEGKTRAIDVNARDDSDLEGAGLTYRLTGNTDDKLFSIDSKTGQLSFKSAPQYNQPRDIGSDNTYNVEVTASDSKGLTDVQKIEISVDKSPISEPPPKPKSDFFLTDEFDLFIAHNDGNNNDIDDVASLPIQAVYINAAGLQDRTTFFFNNNLGEPNNTRGDKTPRNFDQMAAVRQSAAFAEKLGIQTYDYQAGIERTTQKLVDILNSGKKILIFEGGPMEATYRALGYVSRQNRSNITLMTHGTRTFNQTRQLTTRRGVFDTRTWADILRDFPEVNRIQIENQNGPDKSGDLGFNSSLWNWLDTTKDPLLQEARSLMENTRSKSKNDPSDSGMIFYALTGKQDGDPIDAREFFEKHSPSLNARPTLVVQGPLSVTDRQTQVVDIQTVTSNGDREGRGLTYAITGGADRNHFKIDSEGILSFKDAPSFGNPNDTNTDNRYDVEVTVTDSSNRRDRERLDIEVRPSQGPKIISSSRVRVNSDQTLAADINAVDNIDEERSGLIYTITGGADLEKFEIDADSSGSMGLLTFKNPPKSSTPTDANRDNTYQVEVSVTDSDGLTDKQAIQVVVMGDESSVSAPGSSNAVASQSLTETDRLAPIQVGLYDATTDRLIAPIEDGARISADLVNAKNLTIAAVVPDSSSLSGKVESIFLNLNQGAISRVESNEPYALFGDKGGNFAVGQGLSKGRNQIAFDLFAEDKRQGELLGTVTHNFTLV